MKKASFLTFIIILLCIPILFACDKKCSHESTTETVQAPSCSSEGYSLRRCDDCGYEYKFDFVAAKEHTLSSEKFEPTCTEEGYTYYSCECGYSYRSDFLSPTGHTLTSKKFDPTCTDEGYTLLSCQCGYSYRTEFTAPTGHTTYQKSTPPTCTEAGYTTHTCLLCNYSYKIESTAPTGHSLNKEKTHVTSFSDGYTRYFCDCGFEDVSDVIYSEYIFKGAYLDGPSELAQGIDVSKWNGDVDWSEIKAAGIDFVIIRAGNGYNGKDPMFEAHYEGAKAAGLDVGCYFYSYALSVTSALEEADMLLEWIDGKKFEYPVYFDIEDPSQETLSSELLTDMCIAFVEKLQTNGYFCGIYTNDNWISNLLDAERLTPYVDIWLAHWSDTGEAVPPESFYKYTGIWQYSSTGKIGDHTCDFDMNIAYRDYPSLIKAWGYNGY